MGAIDTALAGPWRPTRRQGHDWVRREPALASVGPGHLGVMPADVDDAVLAALWRLGRQDHDAARLLLRCLLPALRSVARGYRTTLGHDEAVAVAVAAMWDRVARFDPPPVRVAYRLRFLAGRHAHAAATRVRWRASHECPFGSAGPTAAVPPDDVVSRLLLCQAVDAGVVSGRSAWLLGATGTRELTIAEAAEALGVSYDTAKKSRQRAALRLRAWVDQADRRAS